MLKIYLSSLLLKVKGIHLIITELHEFIHGRKAPKLEGVRFSVLALGDQTYEYFCQTGRDFDRKLDELGAERIYDRVDCDVDYEEDEKVDGKCNQCD